jgi:hypothetical protein
MRTTLSISKLIIFLLILISFQPRQEIAYLFPFVAFILIFIFLLCGKIEKRFNKFYVNIILFFLFWSAFVTIINKASATNFIFAIITHYSSFAAFLITFAIPYRDEHLRYAISLIIILSLIQVPIGIYQMYKGTNFSVLNPFSESIGVGDLFVGTIGKNSHLLAVKNSFAFIIICSLAVFTKKYKYVYLIIPALLGWLLPSAMHTVIVGVLVMVFFIFLKLINTTAIFLLKKYVSKKQRFIVLGSVLVFFVFLSVAITQKGNIFYAYNLIQKMFEADETKMLRKIISYKNTLFELPKDRMFSPIVGVGFGSYSSRAALITSGEYLSYQPSFIPITPSEETRKYIIPLWNREITKIKYMDGVANQPFSTIQSIYAELGIIGLILFLLVFYKNIKMFNRISKIGDDYLRGVSFAMFFYTFYLFFLFFLDNWFEYPRLMIPYWVVVGLLLKERERIFYAS